MKETVYFQYTEEEVGAWREFKELVPSGSARTQSLGLRGWGSGSPPQGLCRQVDLAMGYFISPLELAPLAKEEIVQIISC